MRHAAVVTVLLSAVASALLPAAAGARRDDRPTELFTPADGAVVKDARKGLKVDFSCPPYHTDTVDQSLLTGGEGYTVTLSRLPDVDAYGALTEAGIVDQRAALPLAKPAGHCESDVNARDEALLPLEPGTYYWQASRWCATYVCPGGREMSFVNRVVVRTTVCSDLRAQSRSASSKLRAARRALRRAPRSAPRRARVARLKSRLSLVRERLRVVYGCAR